MRGNQNYARQDVSSRASKKQTHKEMPLNQRRVLEVLKRRRHATLGAIIEDLNGTRDVLKNVVCALEAQGFVARVGKGPRLYSGPAPLMYRWTGKPFPAVADFEKRHARPATPMSPHIAALIEGMQAMCRIREVAA